MGRELGLNRKTVRPNLRAPSFSECPPRMLRRPGVCNLYLIEHWNTGCWNGTACWKEVIARDYAGKFVAVFSC
jgi:hypothetical protein